MRVKACVSEMDERKETRESGEDGTGRRRKGWGRTRMKCA